MADYSDKIIADAAMCSDVQRQEGAEVELSDFEWSGG